MTLNNDINPLTEPASVPQKSRLIAQGNRQQSRQRQQSMLMRSVQNLESGQV
jgi:hypothetical protein